MFNNGSSYLILGYKESGKSEIAKYILDKIDGVSNMVNLETNFSGTIDKNVNNLIDNYSSKDHKLDFGLNKPNTLILVSNSPLAVPSHKRFFDYVLIPKIGESHNDYALKTVHSNYASCLPFEQYKKTNNQLLIGDFLIFKRINKTFKTLEHVGVINSRNTVSWGSFVESMKSSVETVISKPSNFYNSLLNKLLYNHT